MNGLMRIFLLNFHPWELRWKREKKSFYFIYTSKLLNDLTIAGGSKDGLNGWMEWRRGETFSESFSCLKMIDDLQSLFGRMDGNNSLCVSAGEVSRSRPLILGYFSACEKWISYAISWAYVPATADSDAYHRIFSVVCWCYEENLFVSSLHKPKVPEIR